jgi:hypothetical protein
MNYYVIGDQGQKYGPADIVVLNQWAQQGRITASTVLEDTQTGMRVSALQVPGLQMAPANNFQSTTQSGGYQQGGYQQSGYQNPPNYQQYPRGQYGMGDDGANDVKTAWVLGILGLLCCPVVFSALGIYLASNAQRKGHPGAKNAMYFCIFSLIGGFLLGFLTQLLMR